MAFDRAAFLTRFCDEAEDHLRAIDDALVALEADPGDADLIAGCLRSMHTLKGASRMLKVMDVGAMAHAAEELLVAARDGHFRLEPPHVTLLLRASDAMRQIVSALRGGAEGACEVEPLVAALGAAARGEPVILPPDAASQAGAIAEAEGSGARSAPAEAAPPLANPKVSKAAPSAPEPAVSPVASPAPDTTVSSSASPAAGAAGEPKTPPAPRPGTASEGPFPSGFAPRPAASRLIEGHPPGAALNDPRSPRGEARSALRAAEDTVRVPVAKLDRTIRLMEELSIGQHAVRHRLGELRRLKLGIRRILNRLSGTEGGPGLARMARDLEAILGGLDRQLRSERDLAGHLERLSAEIQQHALEIRLMPIGELFGTLPRAVRDLSNQLGKRVRLELAGVEIELDKRILEGLKAPLVHLVRNAIDHGVEFPEERVASNKDPEARLSIRASHQGGKVEVVVEDDGRGIDIEAAKRVGLARGLLSTDRAEVITEREVLDLLFLPGFSTAGDVSDLSGRGVGLDVVKSQIEELKGAVHVESTEGRGTVFRLIVPVSLTLQTVVLARADGCLYAFPHSFVEETRPVGHLDLIEVAGNPALRLGNQLIPLVDLMDVLGLPAAPRRRVVVIGQAAGERVAFGVDEIAEIDETVIKPVPRGLKAPLVGGFCTVDQGEVVPVLHVPNLIKALWSQGARRGASQRAMREPRRILVVDDSPNTREVERAILEGAGYRVDTAKDGEEALLRLDRTAYHLVVTDIEMPRLDGFALCRRLRENPDSAGIPVVLVTSRATDADRRRGAEVGAAAYIEKGSFDQDRLLRVIQALLAPPPGGEGRLP